MRIARVFPHKRSVFTPTDSDCYFGPPPVYTIPAYDEIHISCVFTWDKPETEYLAIQWQKYGLVKIGGPAYKTPCDDFIPGRYVAPGIIFTTRGCPNRCWFCHVHKIEGDFRELPITPGNIIQDNNILAASDNHWKKLCTMLRGQKQIKFKGGLEARRLTDKKIEDLRGLKIKELWLACDKSGDLPVTISVVKKLRSAGFTDSHINIYVLCGEDMDEESARMEQLVLAGGTPFAQLYQPEERIIYSPEWRRFATKWSRPAAIYRHTLELFT